MFLGTRRTARYLKVAVVEVLAYVRWEQNFDEARESLISSLLLFSSFHIISTKACASGGPAPRLNVLNVILPAPPRPPGHCIGVSDLTDFSLQGLKSWWDLCHPCSSIISVEQHCPAAQSLHLAMGKVLCLWFDFVILFSSSAFIYQAVCLKSSKLCSTLCSRRSTGLQWLHGKNAKGVNENLVKKKCQSSLQPHKPC